MMDILYIPIIGAACLVAVILLLIVSLCIHIRNADSIRIRFLKHSYRSVWLEAPGFCEIQHRNYIYSYQQAPVMACGSDTQYEASKTPRPSIATPTSSSLGDITETGFALSSRRGVNYSIHDRPKFTFEDETLARDIDEDDTDALNISGTSSQLAPAADHRLALIERKPSGKHLQMFAQQSDAEIEMAVLAPDGDDFTATPDTDLATSSLDYLGVGADGIPSSSFSASSSSLKRPNLPQRKIHSVLQDFYRSVRALKLQKADPNDEKLQKLATIYGEQASHSLLDNKKRLSSTEPRSECWKITECDDEDVAELEVNRQMSDVDIEHYSWLRDCVHANRGHSSRPYFSQISSPGDLNLSSYDTLASPGPITSPNVVSSLPVTSLSSSGPSSSTAVPPTTPSERITLGHASGLRRFLFKDSTSGRKQEKSTRLAPRLSSSQTSM